MIKNNNMKTKIFFALIFTLFSFLIIKKSVFAQTPSEVVTPKVTQNEVDAIKDKIASKVAEIATNEQIVFRGKVKKIDSNAKTFDLSNGESTYTVFYLTKTNYFWLKNDNVGKLSLAFGNVDVDDDLIVFGDLIKVENRIDAKVIYGKFFPKVFVGKITDKAGNVLTVQTFSSNSKQLIDISNIKEVTKAGKSDIQKSTEASTLKVNDAVAVKGYFKTKKTDPLFAERVILIQN